MISKIARIILCSTVVLTTFILITCSGNPYAETSSEKKVAGKESGKVISRSNELVILLHGFGKTPRDMSCLEKYFESRRYHVLAPHLPTSFHSLEECTVAFEEYFSEIHGEYNRIHFVGHSIGGLIIRQFLSRNEVANIGRCVLIGTPNKGSELAAIVDRYLKPLTWICRCYESLQPGGVDISPPVNNPSPDMGVIAGSKSDMFLGRFMEDENDGRVPVNSVPFDGMDEFIVLPYHHNEIHHRYETAAFVYRFISDGTFGTIKTQ